MEKIRLAGCIVGALLVLSGCRDATPEEDAADDDSDIARDGGNGCDQDVPNLAAAMEYCGSMFAGSCLFTGCEDCQVCYVDVSCGIPDSSVDVIPCGCSGTGRCYTLCASSADCAENEECINLGWSGGSSVICAYRTRVCWPEYGGEPLHVCP